MWRLTTNGGIRLKTGTLPNVEIVILQKIHDLHMPMYVRRTIDDGVVVTIHPDLSITYSRAGAPITRDEAGRYGWPELLTASLTRAFFPSTKKELPTP